MNTESARLPVPVRRGRCELVGLMAIAAVTMVACSGHRGAEPAGSAAVSPAPVPGSVADQEAVRQTVRSFYRGIVAGDTKSVCSLMTPAAVADAEQAAKAEGGSSCEDWVTETRAQMSSQGVMSPVQIGVGNVTISGDTASVPGSDITIIPSSGMQNNVDVAIALQRIDGRWRVNAP